MVRAVATDIITRATAGDLDPVYILSSDQPLLVTRAVQAIVDAAVPPEMRGFNLDVIEAKDATATRIISTAQTLPMMAQRRAVLVRDLAPMSADELQKLLPYIEAPNPTTVLVALSSKVDKRQKFYSRVKSLKVLHVLDAPKQIGPWIQAEAEARGVSIRRNACDRLAEVVGKDLARLSLALEQLALFAGSAVVTADHVDELIADTRERSVFELLNAMSNGDRAAALAAMDALCEQQESAIGVVTMMARHMRSLGLCHAANQQRIADPAELARYIGVPGWKVKATMAEARRYPPVVVGEALAKLSAADRELKGMTPVVKVLGRQLGERVILDRLVSDIIALRSEQPARSRR